MTVSRKYMIAALWAILALGACGKKQKELTPAQVRAKADSILQTRMGKLRQQAKEDLDRRLPIEVKPKVDSILKVTHDPKPVPVFPGDDPEITRDNDSQPADSAK